MDRRSFILGTGALASQLLVGCADNNQLKLNVQLLKGSIPGQVVNQFSKSLQQKAQLKFAPVGQLQDLFDQLQTSQGKTKGTDGKGWLPSLHLPQFQKTAVADLVTLADNTLKEAIKQKLIQPLEESQLKQWSSLPKRWQELVRRNDQGNLDAQGKIWAAPYRWGSTVIVYRRDKFKELGWTPKDWADLWQSECKGRISLLDQPREVIGIVLKKLGKSYNTENLDKVPSLEKELRTLNQQVKFYASDKYLEPLIIGDTWLAVAWSSDVVRMLPRYPELAAIVPQSGTAMWSDLWVRPVGGKSALSSSFIDFCWTPNIAKQISLLTKTNSPISIDIAMSDIQEPLHNLLVSNSQFFDKNEYLLPLSESTQKQYQDLFTRIKNEA
ncbi:extracellular solute-binding protein [Plectonema radiosum NIES-515]|uniref:Extracellular solute-binding protein n=1 Tax=Plectonema radiosum NIES-515 TaxID=2986073 RepID=A0ABT3AVW8_9CYAN|nr:extracellular solute-binding protein [Plectonema radiosum]MCV3213175.1 extracellular solute-binding protein [Plectonema radiosum NIES-515]